MIALLFGITDNWSSNVHIEMACLNCILTGKKYEAMRMNILCILMSGSEKKEMNSK